MAGGSVVNLNWHGIGTPPRQLDPGEDRTWVSTELFEQVLDLVADRPDVQITFDDGNISDVEIALPRLLERGRSAQFFVLAGCLGQPGRLAESDVRELVRAGMSIGSHGWAHCDWRRMGPEDVADEIERAPEVLAEISRQPVRRVAIPFGSYDRLVLSRLRRAGVERAYTSDGGWTQSTRWLQSRTSMHCDTTADDVGELLDGRPSAMARSSHAGKLWLKRNRRSAQQRSA